MKFTSRHRGAITTFYSIIHRITTFISKCPLCYCHVFLVGDILKLGIPSGDEANSRGKLCPVRYLCHNWVPIKVDPGCGK